MIPSRPRTWSYRPIAVALLASASLACAGPPSQETKVERSDRPGITPDEKGALYAMGVGMGNQLQQLELDPWEASEFARGLQDAVNGKSEVDLASEEVERSVYRFRRQRFSEIAALESADAEPFLEAARNAPGAVVHESGLILTVHEAGEGPSPGIFDFIRVHYVGTLRDGSQLDASGDEPMKRRLGQTIRCWQEALGTVGAGAKIHVVCPASLAYRDEGIRGKVRGGAPIAFDIELVEVIPGEPPPSR